MIYPDLSDSLILPPVNNVYIYAGYKSQSYKAYRKTDDKFELIGELNYESFLNHFNEQKIINKWLQDVGYIDKNPDEVDEVVY